MTAPSPWKPYNAEAWIGRAIDDQSRLRNSVILRVIYSYLLGVAIHTAHWLRVGHYLWGEANQIIPVVTN